LVEYAICIRQWLDRIKLGEPVDFVYKTVDYDEEPILIIKDIGEGLYKIDSIWKEKDINSLLSEQDIIQAFEKYLCTLNNEINLRFHLNLSDFLK